MPKILFEHIDFAEAIESITSPAVRGLVARALSDASINLNNESILLSDGDWQSSRAICDALEEIAKLLMEDNHA